MKQMKQIIGLISVSKITRYKEKCQKLFEWSKDYDGSKDGLTDPNS